MFLLNRQSMQLTLVRGDGVQLPVVIPITATVSQLQLAVQKATLSYLMKLQPVQNSSSVSSDEPSFKIPNLNMRTDCDSTSDILPPKHISWRHFWRRKCLAVINPQASMPPNASPFVIMRLDVSEGLLMENYNVRNGTFISFVRRLKRK